MNILLIDEGEVGMHPDWQIKYIYILLNFIKKLDIKCQIILTSHSPFIISDIPKENIIFLDKYNSEDESIKHSLQKKGNCKVVRDEELIGIEKTFGQNIHTLFTSSYFLKDGLMGEFAKGKINKIIDFYKKVKTLDKENPQFQKEKEALKEKYTSKKNENGTVKDSKQDKFRKIQKMIGEDYLAEIIKNHLEELDWILLGEMPINNRIESLLKKEGLTENKISEILKQIEEGKPSDKN